MIDAINQLADEVAARAAAFAAFIGPDAALDLETNAAAAVPRIISELAQVDDDHLAAEACLTVMSLLWPTASPEDCGQAEWWQSPLGRLCARSLGSDDAESVTHSIAAAMLGVTRGTIGVLVQRGKLDRHPDGGVLRSSVLQRLARRSTDP